VFRGEKFSIAASTAAFRKAGIPDPCIKQNAFHLTQKSLPKAAGPEEKVEVPGSFASSKPSSTVLEMTIEYNG